MVPEKRFTAKQESELAALRLTFEMAVAEEWIVRDEDQPDTLQLVFVTSTAHGDELQTACSCAYGTADLPCAHALGVLRKIREQDHILREVFKRRLHTTPAH